MSETLQWLLPLIPLLPLVGFLVNILGVARGGDAAQRERNAGYVAVAAVGAAFVLSLVAFFMLAAMPHEHEEPLRVSVTLWEWITTGTLRVTFGLLLDPLSAVMMLLVTGVGALIHIYSIGYMHGDEKAVRYFAYLNLFIFMMLMLVMADNLLLLFLGWEGVGLCSFLLIGHWYARKSASSAAVKAFVVNRIGDAAFVLAMLTIFAKFGTLAFFESTVGGQVLPGFMERVSIIQGDQIEFLTTLGQPLAVSTAITLLLLIGVTGKSAQIPLFVWLPDAMEGPTPVSALIHAATMVTAGVYLMARTHALFALSPTTQGLVVFVGAATALVAATAAVAQWDIKRVLAYSTVSQLGYMVAAAGMGVYAVAIFHLLTHGIFKALLFLGSGSVIHGCHDNQDMRRMGGLREHMPTTFWTYMVGAGALAGIFPLAGFWSKDEILATAWSQGNFLIFMVLFLAAMLTAFYMGRQIALVFYGHQRDTTYHPHESGRIMTVPLVILAVGTIIAGAMNLPVLHSLTHWLEPVLAEKAKDFNIALAVISTLAAAGVAYGGWFYYMQQQHRIKVGERDPLYHYTGDVWEIMENAWYFDEIYNKYTFVAWYRSLTDFLGRIFDPEGIDGMVNGVGRFFRWCASVLRGAQSGFVRNYALAFLAGVVVVVGYLVVVR